MENAKPHLFKKTRILCMLTSACSDAGSIRKLAQAGMNIACLDLSEETYEVHRKRIRLVQDVNRNDDYNAAVCVIVRADELHHEKGVEDLRFACRNDADFLILQGCELARDIVFVRKTLQEEGKERIRIIAGLGSEAGIDSLDSILEACDGIFLERDGLLKEYEPQDEVILEKEIVEMCNEAGKPVILTVHFARSMTILRAADAVNLVLEGCDGIFLKPGSSGDVHPSETCELISCIAEKTEKKLPFREYAIKAGNYKNRTIQEAVGIAVSDAALELENVAAIVLFTQSGNTARCISRFRPCVPVIAVTFTRSTQRKLAGSWGVIPVCSEVQNSMTNDDDIACYYAKTFGVKPGQLIILSAGYPTGEGSANMMKIIRVR